MQKLVQRKVYFQDGGKYWKNADWYLGKHLAGMGVKVAIELHSQIPANNPNSGEGHKRSPWAGKVQWLLIQVKARHNSA